ncbi:extracellular solute-binding protein, partial [Escherichia coli]|uniref:extracellular solute-binding protein n=1 Tax=Escherichia coli TaxID=562 RepID=UPI0011202187
HDLREHHLGPVALGGHAVEVEQQAHVGPLGHRCTVELGHLGGHAPQGIQRINNLYLNKAVFKRLGLDLPSDWDGLERAAVKLRAAGITPVAFSDEPWQVATVFEALLLGEAGP